MSKRKRQLQGLTLPWEGDGISWRWLFRRDRTLVILASALLLWLIFGVRAQAGERHRVRKTYNAIGETHRALRIFTTALGRCPRSMVELVHPPKASAHYLREVPKDGWGQTLWVRCPGKRIEGQPDVISSGPSKSFSVDDNIY